MAICVKSEKIVIYITSLRMVIHFRKKRMTVIQFRSLLKKFRKVRKSFRIVLKTFRKNSRERIQIIQYRIHS